MQYEPRLKGLMKAFEPWINDQNVSEIMLNVPEEVFIESKGEINRYSAPKLNEAFLARLSQMVANENHQVLSEVKPMLAGTLPGGERIQIVLPPLSKNIALAIRKPAVKHMSMADFKAQGYFDHVRVDDNSSLGLGNDNLLKAYQSQNWAEFIVQALLLKKNIVISGGTSSGKTTMLNSLLQMIPNTERLITLEDTREMNISHPNHVCLLSYKDEISHTQVCMQELVQCSLRLRPDRIIMGEIRGPEIFDFVSACSTGHSGSLTTIHANSPKIAFMRMCQLYKLNNVPSMTEQQIYNELMAVIDVIMQLEKMPQGRAISQIYYKNHKEKLHVY